MQKFLTKLFVLAAGLAIKDFWGVDADTVVFVADPGLGNILNFNVGENVDLMVPSVSDKHMVMHDVVYMVALPVGLVNVSKYWACLYGVMFHATFKQHVEHSKMVTEAYCTAKLTTGVKPAVTCCAATSAYIALTTVSMHCNSFTLILQNFWPRLASKYGVKKYWQSSGEESAIVNAVSAPTHLSMCMSSAACRCIWATCPTTTLANKSSADSLQAYLFRPVKD